MNHLGLLILTSAGTGGGAALDQWTPAHSMRLAILIGVFIVVVVALGLLILMVRRRMFLPDNDMTTDRTLMDELRHMRDRGDMSHDEYEAARRSLASKVASRVKKEVSEPPPASFGVKLPRSAMPPASNRTARPGYDLTGAPLPKQDPARGDPAEPA